MALLRRLELQNRSASMENVFQGFEGRATTLPGIPKETQDELDEDVRKSLQKFATSIISKLPNLQPGMPKYKAGGTLAAPRTVKPGQSIAPRSDPVPLPTYAETPKWQASSPTLPTALGKKVMVPKPHL